MSEKSKSEVLDPDKKELNKKLLGTFNWSTQNLKTLNPVNIERLLEAGADINTTDINKETALSWATKRSSPEFASLLLQKGADPNIKNKNNKAPLYFALKKDLLDTVKLLLEHEAEKDEYFEEEMGQMTKRFLNRMKNQLRFSDDKL